MDNSSFHKSPKLKEIINAKGCNLLFLPPYSPDFNPIEHQWFGIKNAFRKHIPQFEGDLYKCAAKIFEYDQ
jgi:transposase